MEPDGDIFLKELKIQAPSFFKESMIQAIVPEYAFEYFGILFPEDALHRTKRDGWQFVIHPKKKMNHNVYHPLQAFFGRPMRAGSADMQARIPELKGLKGKKVAVVGLGCVGAPSAIEFAKAGISELRLLDGDHLDAGTTVRWPFGLSVAGQRKVDIIANYIRLNHLSTRVIPINHTIGSCFYPKGGEFDDYEAVEKLLSSADLLYDASSEPGLMDMFSDLADEVGIPYLRVSANEGVWGGIIARVVPEMDACYSCLTWALREDDPPDYRIEPPYSDKKGVFQPTGCAHPTFTGTSFDVNIISMTGVRLAISTLLAGESGQYPAFDDDIFIINLRDSEGRAVPPNFKTYKLRRHPKCQNH